MANHSSSDFAIPRGENGTATKAVGQLDLAGQAILSLLHKAADAAEANSQQALQRAQQVSNQLRAAEDRIAALEVELQLNRDRADRAEGWLSKISTELRTVLLSSRKSEGKRRGDCKQDVELSINERRPRNRRKPPSNSSQWRNLNILSDIARSNHGLALGSDLSRRRKPP